MKAKNLFFGLILAPFIGMAFILWPTIVSWIFLIIFCIGLVVVWLTMTICAYLDWKNGLE